MKQRITAFLKRVPVVTRYLIIAGVALLISLLFPNASSFDFRFEEEGLWRYDNLVSPIDFAVQKPEEIYQAELEHLEANLYPFYVFDENVVKEQKVLFLQNFNLKLQANEQGMYPDVREQRDAYLGAGNRLLDNIYKKGIIQLDKRHIADSKSLIINILQPENRFEKRIANKMTDVKKATLLMNDSLVGLKLQENDFLLDLMEQAILPNVMYSDSITESYHQLEKDKIAKAQGKVNKGEMIVARGQTIDKDSYQKLVSLQERLKDMGNDKSSVLVFIGYLILTLLLIGALVLYLAIFAKDIFTNLQKFSFIMMWVLVFSYLGYFIHKVGFLNAYMIPFCIAPIVIKNFYNERIALFTHVIIVLLAGFLAAQGYEFLFVQILVGIVVVLSDVKTRNWSGFFGAMLYLFLTYLAGYLALEFIRVGKFSFDQINPISWIGLNILLTLLAYPLVPLLERIFGFTSDVTLVELSSLDKPLLRELSLKAPGTLQHSLQVGNLAENAASEIGANALLVKVAALYHDIGKMVNSFYFIENQSGQNLHDKLTPLESANIILGHVTEGEKRAKKEGLPKVLIDFITSHHGTTRVEYFYKKHLKENPDEAPNPEAFTYKGMKPQTKEQAILMMADSIEAAAKSLKTPDEEAINNLVEKIISGKIAIGQLDETNLTYKEMNTIKRVFKKLLKSIYHVRIEYTDK